MCANMYSVKGKYAIAFYCIVTPHDIHLTHVILLWMLFYVIDSFTVKVIMLSESLGLMY